jgi:hypothetical protein
MPKADQILAIRTAEPVAREELLRVMEKRLHESGENTVLSFVVRPIQLDEELGVVLDRMSHVAADNQCNGNVWTPQAQESRM